VKKLNILLFIILIAAVLGMIALFQNRGNNKHTNSYPFFLSTKFSTSNIRSGPGEEYPIIWVYKKKNIPFKVIAEYKNWYQIQDYNGKVGWIFKNTTSKTKSAITNKKIEVYKTPEQDAKKIATIDKGIIVIIHKIKGEYVQILLSIDKVKIDGWTLKSNLWGEYKE